MKPCKRCGEVKPLTAFSPRKDAKDGLAYWCTPCKTEATRKGPNRAATVARYRSRNASACAARVAASTAKNAEVYKAKQLAWRTANKERVLEGRRRRYADNPAPEILRVRKRQQRIRTVPAWLTPAHLAEIDGLYRFCKVFRGFEVDHIIPLNGKQVSGLHVPDNLQVLTVSENRRKGAIFKE